MTVRKQRVAFVNTHPIQYFAPLYRHINRSADIEAVPVYLTDFSLRGAVDPQFGEKIVWDVDLLAGTDPLFVPGYATRAMKPGPLRMWAPGIWRIIRDGNFDAVVIHGHAIGANHLALLAAKSRGIAVFHRAETHLGLPVSPFRALVRKLVMKPYYRLFDGFLAIGSLNRAWYRAMEVGDARIFDFPYTVDNDRLIPTARLDEAERAKVRNSLGLRAGQPVVVFASKLMRRKHPDALLEAAIALRGEGLDFDLLFIGSGELQVSLEARAQALKGTAARFAGFVNQSDMPRLLGGADIFVLPSAAEPWGLIINEAMCASLPIIASAEIGAVPDLVHDGVNGATIEAGDPVGIANALRPLLSDPARIRAMGDESLRRIGAWNYDRNVDELRAALAAIGKRD